MLGGVFPTTYILGGKIELLKEQIQRKLSKGKSIDEIAEELEESVTIIQNLIVDGETKK